MPTGSNKSISSQQGNTSTRQQPANVDLTPSSARVPHPTEVSAPQSPLSWSFFSSLSLPGENAAYTLHDGNSRFLDATQGSEAIWESTPSQLKGQTLANLSSENSDFKSWLLSIEPQATQQSYRLALSSNSSRVLNLKAIPLFIGNSPEETRVVVKAVPAANQLPSTFPVNPNLSSTHTFDGRFETLTSSWPELFGSNIAEFKTLSLTQIVHHSDHQRLEFFLNQAREADSVISQIIRFRADGGQIKTLLLSARRDADEPKLVVEAKNMTVEGNNLAMDLLKTSVELVNESVMLLAKVGPGFRICYANRAFEAMTGYRYSTVAGNSLACLNGPKTSARAILNIEEALQEELEHTGNILLYRKSGDSFWANANLIPLRDNSGNANHFAVILEDTSKVKAVTEELARKNKELQNALGDLKETQKTLIQQESLRALGQMASGIAHDFNNLLAPILGFSELLLNVPNAIKDEKKIVQYLKRIQTAAQDGAAVVSRLREFYRSQNSPEEFIHIQPEELIYQVKELTRHRWKNQSEANGLGIDFKIEIDSTRMVMGNEPELRQVFANLIINAVDAMDRDGAICISVKDFEEYVRIEISDTGSGMTEKTRANCMDPFYTTKGKLGTGLGLSIVFGVVQRHHGEFNIHSVEGEGTRIVMDFPVAKAKKKNEADPEIALNSRALKIMLVDDEEVLLEVVSELLVAGGHSVDIYANAHTALSAFKEQSYDLVITDRAMPLMSGDQFAGKIKEISPNTPVFMITGFGDVINDTGDLPEHIDEVISKPVPLDVLNRKLAELTERKR